ncbi:MAG: hypothetical protein IH599_08930, partial [Bacteroidales bacterium]|nr:hypothetical protein [Bacteroidales bacterium]
MKYYKTLSLILSLILSLSLSSAQEVRLCRAPGGNALLISGALALDGGYFVVERRGEGQKDFTELGRLSFPATEESFAASLISAEKEQGKPQASSRERALALYGQLKAAGTLDKDHRLDLAALLAAGMAWVDKDLAEGVGYTYQVRQVDRAGKAAGRKELSVRRDLQEENLPSPVLVSAEGSRALLRIRWTLPGPWVSGGLVYERRRAGEREFEQVAVVQQLSRRSDSLIFTVLDTTARPLESYICRIRALNAWYMPGEFSQEALVNTALREELPVPYGISAMAGTADRTVTLSWKLDDQQAVKEVLVFRSPYP